VKFFLEIHIGKSKIMTFRGMEPIRRYVLMTNHWNKSPLSENNRTHPIGPPTSEMDSRLASDQQKPGKVITNHTRDISCQATLSHCNESWDNTLNCDSINKLQLDESKQTHRHILRQESKLQALEMTVLRGILGKKPKKTKLGTHTLGKAQVGGDTEPN
jgi:hypothetical protein